MKIAKFLFFFFFFFLILYFHVVSSFTDETNLTDQHGNPKHSQDINEMVEVNKEGKKYDETKDLSVVQRPKGGKSGGRGAGARHPKKNAGHHNGALASLPWTSPFISVTMTQVSFGLLVGLLFFF